MLSHHTLRFSLSSADQFMTTATMNILEEGRRCKWTKGDDAAQDAFRPDVTFSAKFPDGTEAVYKLHRSLLIHGSFDTKSFESKFFVDYFQTAEGLKEADEANEQATLQELHDEDGNRITISMECFESVLDALYNHGKYSAESLASFRPEHLIRVHVGAVFLQVRTLEESIKEHLQKRIKPLLDAKKAELFRVALNAGSEPLTALIGSMLRFVKFRSHTVGHGIDFKSETFADWTYQECYHLWREMARGAMSPQWPRLDVKILTRMYHSAVILFEEKSLAAEAEEKATVKLILEEATHLLQQSALPAPGNLVFRLFELLRQHEFLNASAESQLDKSSGNLLSAFLTTGQITNQCEAICDFIVKASNQEYQYIVLEAGSNASVNKSEVAGNYNKVGGRICYQRFTRPPSQTPRFEIELVSNGDKKGHLWVLSYHVAKNRNKPLKLYYSRAPNNGSFCPPFLEAWVPFPSLPAHQRFDFLVTQGPKLTVREVEANYLL